MAIRTRIGRALSLFQVMHGSEMPKGVEHFDSAVCLLLDLGQLISTSFFLLVWPRRILMAVLGTEKDSDRSSIKARFALPLRAGS